MYFTISIEALFVMSTSGSLVDPSAGTGSDPLSLLRSFPPTLFVGKVRLSAVFIRGFLLRLKSVLSRPSSSSLGILGRSSLVELFTSLLHLLP